MYPYLLRDRLIRHANEVWCADITYVPVAHGFAYVVAIMGWHTRHVLSWRLSTTQDTECCLEAVDRYGKPLIFNTDQGSQFTSSTRTGALQEAGIRISMDGTGNWTDNVFIERLWRSMKYECVYLSAFDTIREAQEAIRNWMTYCNEEWPHSTLGDQTPSEVYAANLKQAA